MKKDLENKVVFGVCSGIGRYLGVERSLIRLSFIAATFLGFGSPILIYLILALIMD